MSQCMKALREFFENCKAFLYSEDDCGCKEIYEPKPFALKVEWSFDKDCKYKKDTPYCNGVNNDCLYFHGMGLMDDREEIIYTDKFTGGPFIIPPGGGTIECKYHNITFGSYTVEKIFEKPKKRRLRKLSDARVERMKKIYENYGEINGWGIEFNKNHEDAIAVYFETAHDINNAPKFFESWPVVCHVLGP